MRYNPLGLAARAAIGASLCFSAVAYSTAATAAACQAGDPNCVLPIGEAPPPVVQQTAPPPPIVEDVGGGMGWLLPLLAVLAAVGLGFILLNDDDEDVPVSP